MNLLLFIAGIYLVTFVGGGLIEKLRVPWVFAALFFGLMVSPFPAVAEFANIGAFDFLSQLGVAFLLFLVGFDLNIQKIKEQGTFIISTTLFIILTESIFGTLFIHAVFGTPWPIAVLVATSFATVGEGVLLPILDEFKITKTNFGQLLLGIATLDDIIEVMTLIALSFFLGFQIGHSNLDVTVNALILVGLFVMTFIFVRLQNNFHRYKFHDVPSLFIFLMFLLLLFIGIGELVESAALGALLAGIAAQQIIPQKKLVLVESDLRTMAYGFFVPLFFFSVGVHTDIRYIVSAPLIVLAVLLLTNLTKIGSSYVLAKRRIGSKQSILLGIGLSAKFSTSIVIITLLFDRHLIGAELFSVLVGAMVLSKFIIPVLFSTLIIRWKKVLN